MNINKQIRTVNDILAVFSKNNISKLDSIAIMEVLKYELLRQSATNIPQQGDIA